MFYDWSECVMSVLGTQNILRAISVLTLGNKVILCIVYIVMTYPRSETHL